MQVQPVAYAAAQAIGGGGVITACYRTSEDDRKGELRAVSDSTACRTTGYETATKCMAVYRAEAL